MRILHIIPSLSPADGGPSHVLPLMVKGLEELGHQVVTAATHGKEGAVAPGGTAHHSFPRQVEFYKVSLPLKRWVADEVNRFDVVHIHALFSHSSVEAARIAWARRIPYVIRPLGVLNQYGVQSRRRWLKKLSLGLREAPVIRQASAMHFTSEVEKQEASQLGIPMRSQVIPLGIDLPDTCANRTGAENRNVLFLSRIDPKKNLESLIEAWSLLDSKIRQTWRLKIAGEGDPSYVKELKQLASRHATEAEIEWLGFVAGQEKEALLSDASIFVLPSFSENFGIAAVEAMGAGIPAVIAPGVAVGSAAAEEQGCLLTGTTPDRIADSLTRMILSSKEREVFARRGREFVQQHYSVSAMAKSLESLYTDILEHSSRS